MRNVPSSPMSGLSPSASDVICIFNSRVVFLALHARCWLVVHLCHPNGSSTTIIHYDEGCLLLDSSRAELARSCTGGAFRRILRLIRARNPIVCAPLHGRFNWNRFVWTQCHFVLIWSRFHATARLNCNPRSHPPRTL